jgi:sulfotransferase family protein
MAEGLRVVGAGMPRTGTMSLRVALEHLLGGTCYHMSALFERQNVDVPTWLSAVRGEQVDWSAIFTGCTAAIDWPASVFWRELAAAYPDALVVLSTRNAAESWWRSVDATVWRVARAPALVTEDRQWIEMITGLIARVFGPDWDDPASAMATYERHNDEVRRAVPPDRLLEWSAADGWGPLCRRLGLPVPAEPFPRVNTTDEFVGRIEGRDEDAEH